MQITVEHNGTKFEQFEIVALNELGVPKEIIGRGIKDYQAAQISEMADNFRQRISRASANKLAEFRIKEEIAANKASASKGELALLTREAKARGLSLDELLTGISRQAAKFRQAALLVAALEAEGMAAINALEDDDPAVEIKTTAIIDGAKKTAEEAYEGLA